MKKKEKAAKLGVKRLILFIEKAGINVVLRQKYLRLPNNDFTRKRKLYFSMTVSLILSFLKKVYPPYLLKTTSFLKGIFRRQNPPLFKLERR